MNKTLTEPSRSNFTSSRIELQRELVDECMSGRKPLLIAGIGQCSLNIRDVAVTLTEANDLQSFMFQTPNVFTLQRHNYSKPRSDPSAWKGIGSSHPEAALKLHNEVVEGNIAICGEIMGSTDLHQFGDGLVLGWIGARNSNMELLAEISKKQPTLPLGIKNALTGDLEDALERVRLVNELRQTSDGNASAFLIHRGGTELDTPKKWEESVKRTIEEQAGAVMIDLAHGAEQAHDPDKTFSKTVAGQAEALEHYARIVEQTGIHANGLLIEASEALSDTDPNMPHQLALNGVRRIAQMKGEQAKLESVWQS